MADEMLPFGEPLADQNPDHLTLKAARDTVAAIEEHRDFRLLELRGDRLSEMIVVECECDRIFSKSSSGIRFREPLSLRFFRDPKVMPEVRALRADFPVLLHENQPKAGEPKWLCIYREPWPQLRRTWTAQSFLSRIKWWLEGSAEGTLHPPDQTPEQLYFDSLYSIVLPADFDRLIANKDNAASIERRTAAGGKKMVCVAHIGAAQQLAQRGERHFSMIALTLPSIGHASPEMAPHTLGELHDRLAARGAPLDIQLFQGIQGLVMGSSLVHADEQKTFLVLTIPVTNPAGGEPRSERRGFLVDAGLGKLGESAGVLVRDEKTGRYVAAHHIGGLKLDSAWRPISIAQVEILDPFTADRARRYSGVAAPGPDAILAGVGALGSAMAELWQREGWGRWRYVDPDLLLPHNLARHRGFEHQIGSPKVDVVRQLEGAIDTNIAIREGYHASANDFENADLVKALRETNLIVDATTTLEVPRDFAMRDDIPRCASVFITPSGADAVMILEDASRRIRLDVLEAQYYRFVLNASWGSTHLRGHQGKLLVGAGCRDISLVLSGELIQLHAALLARQVRLRSAEADACIQVWRSNPDSGEVTPFALPVAVPECRDMGGIQLVWDQGLRAKIRRMREQGLPNETGGVLLGYWDRVNERVYVVDALPAPPDSLKSGVEFGRGAEGLVEKINESLDRTANIVGYVGEWHSHPRGVEAEPSRQDVWLLIHLALTLRQDGSPVLMLIAGENDERWILGEVGG